MSAKGTDVRRQTMEEFVRSSGGALDTVPVLRVQVSAKGTDVRRQTMEELARSSSGALDTVPVLRVLD
jgi:hypothetical protein